MSWNNSGNEQKGWGPKSTPPGGSPPDLEELFKQWYKKLFGAKGPTRTGSAKPNKANSIGAGLIVVGLSALYMVSGIYIVQPAERVVITRFGKYMDIVGPGPHWFARGIEQKYVVDVQAVHTTRHGGLMLTRDENIVNVEIAVQYCIDDARAYLFNVDDPERSLKQVTDSSLRYVVGHSTLDEVLTHGRSELAAAVRTQIKETLAGYSTGLSVVEVALQPATPPEEVKSAFDDVIRAQEDEQSLMNEADAYARKVEPIAQGQSRRILEEAQAYKERVVLHATGDASRFAAVLPAY
ncbi:MAG: FtsH protease activity modulator HflK, partial [Pseudomonadota bacterium]